MERIQPLEVFAERNTFLINEMVSWININKPLERKIQLNFDKQYSEKNNNYTTYYNQSEFTEINYKPIYYLEDEVLFMELFNALEHKIEDILNYNEFARFQLNSFKEVGYNKWIFEIEDFFREDLKNFFAVAQEVESTGRYRVFKNNHKDLFINIESLKQISNLFELYNKHKANVELKEYKPKFNTSEIKDAIIKSCLKREIRLALPYIICSNVETKFPSKYRLFSFLNNIVSNTKERIETHWTYYKSNWNDEGKNWVSYNFIEEDTGKNLCIPPLLFREEGGKLYFNTLPF